MQTIFIRIKYKNINQKIDKSHKKILDVSLNGICLTKIKQMVHNISS